MMFKLWWKNPLYYIGLFGSAIAGACILVIQKERILAIAAIYAGGILSGIAIGLWAAYKKATPDA